MISKDMRKVRLVGNKRNAFKLQFYLLCYQTLEEKEINKSNSLPLNEVPVTLLSYWLGVQSLKMSTIFDSVILLAGIYNKKIKSYKDIYIFKDIFYNNALDGEFFFIWMGKCFIIVKYGNKQCWRIGVLLTNLCEIHLLWIKLKYH